MFAIVKNPMTRSERRMAFCAMLDAGYDLVEEDRIEKLSYEKIDVYVCVVGDAMVVYTPYNRRVNFFCF